MRLSSILLAASAASPMVVLAVPPTNPYWYLCCMIADRITDPFKPPPQEPPPPEHWDMIKFRKEQMDATLAYYNCIKRRTLAKQVEFPNGMARYAMDNIESFCTSEVLQDHKVCPYGRIPIEADQCDGLQVSEFEEGMSWDEALAITDRRIEWAQNEAGLANRKWRDDQWRKGESRPQPKRQDGPKVGDTPRREDAPLREVPPQLPPWHWMFKPDGAASSGRKDSSRASFFSLEKAKPFFQDLKSEMGSRIQDTLDRAAGPAYNKPGAARPLLGNGGKLPLPPR